jgi:hypothetical protein
MGCSDRDEYEVKSLAILLPIKLAKLSSISNDPVFRFFANKGHIYMPDKSKLKYYISTSPNDVWINGNLICDIAGNTIFSISPTADGTMSADGLVNYYLQNVIICKNTKKYC